MFGIGTTEIVVILVVALLVLGPKKLPEIARSLGKTLGEFRRVTTDVKRTIEMEADQDEEVRARKRIRREMSSRPGGEDAPSEGKKASSPEDEQDRQPRGSESYEPEQKEDAPGPLSDKESHPEAEMPEKSQTQESETRPETESETEPEKKDGVPR